jgi:hypothetical protein
MSDNTKRGRNMKSINESEITNIRYGPIENNKGTILFDFRGNTITIKEPDDVILVDVDYAAAARWIMERYAYLLAQVR